MNAQQFSDIYDLSCKYCGYLQQWEFIPDDDFATIEDVMEYDFECICKNCGCAIRVNESIKQDINYIYE